MTRLTIFLFFFTLSTMAQITVSGRIFDEKKKPFPKAIVSKRRYIPKITIMNISKTNKNS